MNANELADELEIAQGNNNADELIPEAITMLRQQQDEIEVNKYGYELDINIKIEELKEKDVCLKLLMDKICQQQAEILAGKIMIKGYGKTIDEQQAEIEVLKDKLDEAEQRYWNNK